MAILLLCLFFVSYVSVFGQSNIAFQTIGMFPVDGEKFKEQLIEPRRHFSVISKYLGLGADRIGRNQSIYRFEETVKTRVQKNGTLMPEPTSSESAKSLSPEKPFFVNQSIVESTSRTIPPGRPWPSKPEDYVGSRINFQKPLVSQKPLLSNRLKETTTTSVKEGDISMTERVSNSSAPTMLPGLHRPSFAGQSSVGILSQIIPPGRPWPSKPDDYVGFSVSSQKPLLSDRFKETTTTRVQEDDIPITETVSNPRPSFAGQSSVGIPSQIIPPGQPWPSKPEDYVGFSVSSQKPLLSDRFKETTTTRVQEDDIPITETVSNPRPSFAGQSSVGIPSQIIPPGRPWPSKPEDYVGFSVSSQKPLLSDRFKETTTKRVQEDDIPITETVSNPRPSFAGQSSVGIPSQIIPPGRPWPSKPEDYVGFSVSSQKPLLSDRFKETTTTRVQEDDIPMTETVSNPRPSFAGQSSVGIPSQIIPPGRPWPSKPEDYVGFSVSSQKPLLSDRFKETTTTRVQEDDIPITETVSNPRPSFAGQSSVGIPSQIIPPGRPWPSKPEDYVGFSVSSQKPLLSDRFKETTTKRVQEDDIPITETVSNPRPSFAGQSSVGIPSQIIPPGRPWPSKPEDYVGFSVSSQKPLLSDRFKETTTKRVQEDDIPITETVSNPRPSSAGQSSVGIPSQIIPPGRPWPSKPDDYVGFSVSSQKPLLSDRFKETTTTRVQEDDMPMTETVSNSRPSFAGQSSVGIPSQIIPPGRPWPSKPDDYVGSSVSSQKPLLSERFKETTTKRVQEDDIPITETVSNPRPSFAGQSSVGIPSQIIPPGRPWPSKPEDYVGSSVSAQKPLLSDRFKETTTTRVQEDDMPMTETVSNSRSSSAGQSSVGIPSQIIPPGQPWPSRLKNDESFNVSSKLSIR